MGNIISDLVKSNVEKLIDGAIGEARHVFCFTCIVKEFEEESAKLEHERKTMVQRVKVAKERDNDIQANVGSWLKEIDKLNEVDTKTKQTCFFEFCPDCIWRYKKGKELANNLNDIKRLLKKGATFVNIELPRSLPGVEHYSSKDYISFESREATYKQLLDALKDDNNYITGLYGMGGTGKTTLAKEVGKELKQSKQFAYVVDTTVSFTPDVKKIQDDIAGSLGLEWKDCNESDRPKKLWNRLTSGDKILVILDDVWDGGPALDFDAIGIPKQDNRKGCRVLVTSRSKETFYKMDCYRIIELVLLSEEEAWNMFKRYARISDTFPKKLIDKGRKIAKECKQLPVAISAIASSLKGHQHREHKWDVTLKSLKKPGFMGGVDSNLVGIYNCLKISYDNLMDAKVQRLFLLCSVFREDEKISIEVLTRLCIGVGLFGEDYGSYDDVRNQVVEAKEKLVYSCLLLEVGDKHLRMHDLVRDAAQWIANNEIRCVKLFDKNHKSSVEKQTNIKYLLCEGKYMDLFSFNFDGSKLETLIVNVDRDEDNECIEVPNSFFEKFVKLRVLNFSGNYQQTLSLPGSIRSLANIRSMLIDNVDLGDISILGNLQTLETLDLVGCKINELPNQITELRKFRLLKLKWCEIRMNNPFEVIKGCSSLEELYLERSFNDFCHEITIPKLQRYRVRNCWKTFYSDRTNFLKYVVFCGDETCRFSEETLKYCMQTAEVICLEGIMGEWRNLMPEIVELGMNDLVELQLSKISQLQCLIDTTGCSQAPNVFSKLVALELVKMGNLEELFNGSLSFESLSNLEKLSIKDCENLQSLFKGKLLCNLKSITIKSCPLLVSLFEVSTSQSLVLLETLKISKCEGLETIISREDEEIDDSGNNKSIASVFSKLKYIHIKKCHQFESILPFLSAQDLPVLETIRIRECKGLKYVFGQSQHVELVSLSELELSELPKFIGIFEECYYDAMSSCVKGSSSTSNNYSVATESNSYDIRERVECLPIQSKILCNVKEIVLSHFPKMKSVFILPIDPIMQLETLRIMNCDELKHIIIDTGDHNTGDSNCIDVFLKLKDLCVEDCAQLEYIFGNDTNDHQNHMEVQLHFSELKWLQLCNLPNLVTMCPKQYRISFPSLESLELKDCSQVDVKSVFHSVSESMDHTMIKELSGNVDHFLTLERLEVYNNSKVENIFSLGEVHGQLPLDLGLEFIELHDLPMMTCLFLGPKDSFALKNLERIEIVRCDKLKTAFSTSILRFLPQLYHLRIEECKEMEHIIEDDDDLENKKISNSLSSRTCFPKLAGISVMKCNKLKYVFPFSVCKELLKLKLLLITEANELEKIFKSEDDQKVDIPNLNILAFDMLPSLCCAQGNQFQAVKNRFVRNCCQKPTLTSASTTNTLNEIDKLFISSELSEILRNLFKQLPSSETTEHFDAGIGAQATLDHGPDLANVENDGIEQLPNAETAEDFELPSVQNVQTLTILPTNSELKGSTSEKTPVATVSIISGTKNEPPIQVVAPNQKGIEIEGTSKTNNDQVSLNDDAFMKVNSNVEKQFSKDGEIIGSKSKPSPNITSPIASQFPSIPSKGDPFLVKSELEELVSKNHLDHENLSLLIDFLVDNPSVRLKDTSLNNRYKGYAYNLLAELLKFLKTHSLLEVSGSYHSEFLELLQVARNFAFDKEWLDGVESRALFPEIQVSPDALEKLLYSKKRVTKDVEDLRFKIDILSQHVEDLKLQLTSSEAELESIIQQEAVLCAPIGY